MMNRHCSYKTTDTPSETKGTSYLKASSNDSSLILGEYRSISNEESREYVFPNNNTIRIFHPSSVLDMSDYQVVRDNEGNIFWIKRTWENIIVTSFDSDPAA